MARLRVGTSGYAYKEWKGSFYPEKLPAAGMLGFYAERFPTVEINHSFYRMPTEKILDGWASGVPTGFQFALKLNQKITHIQRLKNCEDLLRRFLEVSSILAQDDRLGPVLVQLPPNFRADLPRLDAFLQLRPRAIRFALEVRHVSWHTDEFYELLRRHQTALCLAETDEDTPPDLTTTDFTYLRLRRESYTPKQLAAWKKRMDDWVAGGVDVFAYIKHEDAGKAPAYARRLLET